MADVRLTATNPEDSSVVPVACNEKGELKLEEIPDQSFDGNLQGDLTVSGSASFAGDVTVGGDKITLDATDGNADFAGVISNYRADNSGYISTNFVIAQRPDGGGCIRVNNPDGTTTAQITGNGSAKFAEGKAGFTAEGHLWCTTRRGDTVILDATSNGLGSWVPYTPPNRLTELQDKLAQLKPGPPTDIDSSRLTKD